MTTTRWLLAGVVLVAAGLRLSFLGWSGLRLDEAFTWWVAADSGQGVLPTVVAADTHPPLYYLFQRVWMGWFDSLPWARLPSALFGVATVPVLYAVGREVRGRSVGLVAAGLLAVSPWHLWHAQDVRSYSLLTFAVALAILAAMRTVSEPRRSWRWPALFAASGVVAVLTHNIGSVLVAAIAVPVLVVVARRGRRRAVPWLTAALLVLVSWIAWVPSLVRQLENLDQNLAWINHTVSWSDAATGVAAGWVGAPPAPGGEVVLAVGISIALAAWGAWVLRGRAAHATVLLSALLVLPLIELLSMFSGSPFLVVRSLLPTSLALFILIAVGVTSVPDQAVSSASAVALVAALAMGGLRLVGADATAWEDVTRLLETEARPDETVVYVTNVGEFATDWLGDVPGRSLPLPGRFDERLVWDEQVTFEAVVTAAEQVLSTSPVWLVYSHGDRLDPQGHVLAWLEARSRRELSLQYGGIEVRRYGPEDTDRRSASLRAPTTETTSSPKSNSE